MNRLIETTITGGSNASPDIALPGKLIGFFVRSSVAADITVVLSPDSINYFTLSPVGGTFVASLTGPTDLRCIFLADELSLEGMIAKFRSSVVQTSTVTLYFVVEVP